MYEPFSLQFIPRARLSLPGEATSWIWRAIGTSPGSTLAPAAMAVSSRRATQQGHTDPPRLEAEVAHARSAPALRHSPTAACSMVIRLSAPALARFLHHQIGPH